jgi:hypothetical protein
MEPKEQASAPLDTTTGFQVRVPAARRIRDFESPLTLRVLPSDSLSSGHRGGATFLFPSSDSDWPSPINLAAEV